jgi:ribosomal protein S6--L-glutamate ligase
MRLGVISLGGKSSLAIAEDAKQYFDRVDNLNIKEFEVHVSKSGINVAYEKKDLEKYDCLYVRGSYKYALLQRAITRALNHELYMPIKPETFTIGHDKFLTMIELQRCGVNIPKTYYAATTKLAMKILEEEVDYPVIMKVPEGTHGKGVMIADSVMSAKTVLDVLEGFKQPYIIQEFVETAKTTDVRAIVIGNKVVAAYKRQAAKGEVRANVHAGGKRMPHILTNDEWRLAVDSAKALGCDVCGVDILNAERPSVIEINLSPGVKAVEEVTGKNVTKEIAKFLYDETVKFREAEKKKGFDAIKKDIELTKNQMELRDFITNLNVKAGIIKLPKEITKITKFDEEKEVIICAKKGKLEIREL